MEEGYSEKRHADFRKFLNGFVGDKDSPLFADDPIQFRGSIVGSFRLPSSDVPAEILDWVLLYLYQRKCPHELAWVLAREVQTRMEAMLPSIVPPVTNGGTNDVDSPDEGQYLLDSSLLHGEMLSQLQQVCSQLHNSEAELLNRSTACRPPQYQVSMVAIKNGRRKMEDRHIVIQDLNALCGLVDGPPQSYYAVFDGHSGVEAASFCSAHLHWHMVQHPKFECDPEVAFREAFATTEEAFHQRSQREGIKSGCTAISCLIRDRNFYLAWLGDSQAILVKKGMPITIMSPHKPDRLDEKERVEKLGGCVMHVGTWRVNGILAVSRALGDFEHKPCVSSEPDIINLPLDGDEDFLVLACDGLWDTLTPNDVTAAVYHYINQENGDIDDIAVQVAQQAINRGSTDNVTVIIVFLRDLESLAAQSAVTSFSSDSVVNHKTNSTDETDSSIPYESKNIFENGDGDYNFGMKIGDSLMANGPEEIYHPPAGLMPEATSISELPTPPIEDLIAAEGLNSQLEGQSSGLNPFDLQSDREVHDSHAKEIASAILNSALESATHSETETESTQLFASDSAFFSGQEEVNPPLDVVAECDNQVATPKPWVLQVEHSSQPDLVDYLPSDNIEVSSPVVESPGEQYPDFYAHQDAGFDPFASFQEHVKPNDHFGDENRGNVPADSAHLEGQIDFGFEESDVVESVSANPFELEPVPTAMQSHLEDAGYFDQLPSCPEVPSQPDQRLPDLASQFQVQAEVRHEFTEQVQVCETINEQEYSEHEDSRYNPFGGFEGQPIEVSHEQSNQNNYLDQFESLNNVPQMQQDFNPFGTVMEEDANMFGFAEETPSTLRPLHGVPEMIGISEAVPGIQTSEPLVSSEHHMTAQKEVLAAFENILVPSSPDQPPTTTVADLLQPPISFFEEDGVEELEVPESPEHVAHLLEAAPAPPTVSPSPVSEMQGIVEGASFMSSVQNSLYVDFIAPQMTVPELNDAEAVASNVPPTPEVVLEKIPDGVPEADDVTEDSDSEKDGGWSYISGKGKDPATAGTVRKKTKATPGATSTVKRTSSTGTTPKDVAKSPPAQKPAKPADNKTKPAKASGATATTKAVPKPSSTSTLKKAPAEPIKKAPTSTMVRPKPTTAQGKMAVTSRTTTSSTTNGTITKSKEVEVKATTTKSSTSSRPALSALVKKPTQPLKPPSASATSTTRVTSSTTTTMARAGTLKATKPSAPIATTAARPAPRPMSSTLLRPTTKPSTARPATTTAATLSKKTTITSAAGTRSPNTAAASAKVPPARLAPKTTTTTAAKLSTESKLTKNTVNKQLVGQTGTLKSKTATSTTTVSNKTTSVTKSSTLNKSGSKSIKTAAATAKTATKTKEENEASKDEATKSEPEKGSLEDKGKDNHAVDSGLASPESPVSPQLLMVNGNHQDHAAMDEKTALVEPAELN